MVWNCHADDVAEILWRQHCGGGAGGGHLRSATLYNTLQNDAPGSPDVPGNITEAVCKIFVDSCTVCNAFETTAAAQKQYRSIKSSWLFERMQTDCLLIKYGLEICLYCFVLYCFVYARYAIWHHFTGGCHVKGTGRELLRKIAWLCARKNDA